MRKALNAANKIKLISDNDGKPISLQNMKSQSVIAHHPNSVEGKLPLSAIKEVQDNGIGSLTTRQNNFSYESKQNYFDKSDEDGMNAEKLK